MKWTYRARLPNQAVTLEDDWWRVSKSFSPRCKQLLEVKHEAMWN
jgi:hypothetical protein